MKKIVLIALMAFCSVSFGASKEEIEVIKDLSMQNGEFTDVSRSHTPCTTFEQCESIKIRSEQE